MRLRLSEIPRIWPIAKKRVAEAMISFIQKIFLSDKFVKDVFGKGHERRVLMCHLPEAFAGGELPKYHSNLTECHVIAECFDRLGYSIDCTSRTRKGLDYSPYDIVFGINGNAFMGSFTADRSVAPLRIFYPVGAETCYNYRVTAMRNADFHRRHGMWMLGSNRYMPGDPRNYYEAQFSDAVICMGDNFVLDRFADEEKVCGKYRLLPAFYFPVAGNAASKDFAKCRRTLLWFGSSGMVHKGLDIAMDFALEHPEFTLHICGGSRQEKEFWNYYMPKIEGRGNIILHGFVDIESEMFAQLLSQCGMLLNPSISEGGAVAVLNVIGNGALLPVCSEATGIDFGGSAVVVPHVTYKAFEEAVMLADSMPCAEFERRAWDAHRTVKDNFTLEQYRERMYCHLKEIIENRK